MGRQVRPGDETPAIPLRLTVPRRGKAPNHFADLTSQEQRHAVGQLGEPEFRARQLANQYFGNFSVAPSSWTDIPRHAREKLARNYPEFFRS